MVSGLCLRKVRLEQEVDYVVAIEQLFPALRGKLSHHLTESWPEPSCLYEVRFELPIALPNGRTVRFTGQIDKLDPVNRTITDFKTKDKALPTAPDPSHIFQLNCYRLLAAEGWPQQPVTADATGAPLDQPLLPGSPAGIHVDRLAVVYWTTARLASTRRSEPPARVVSFDVPVLPEIRQELIQRLLAFTDDTLPPVPPQLDPYSSVFCREWCPVNAVCRARLDEAIGF
mgnify:CR=1 FL=1